MFIKYFESLLNSNNCFYYPPRISEKNGRWIKHALQQRWAMGIGLFWTNEIFENKRNFSWKSVSFRNDRFLPNEQFFRFLNNSFFSFPNDARTKWKNTNVPMSTSQGGPTYSWAISGTACFCGLGNSITDRMIDSKKQ